MSTYSAKRALLSNIVDYAGTFPPAALSLEAALKEAATCRTQLAHPWLFSKMALPLDSLKKLSPRLLSEQGADGHAWLFTALGSAQKDESSAADFAQVIDWDLREASRFNDRFWESSVRQGIIGYETRLPANLLSNPQSEVLRAYLDPALDRVTAVSGNKVQLYIEIPWLAEWKKSIDGVADAITFWMEENAGLLSTVGLKFRTGGQYQPTAEQLAHAISVCVSRRLKIKTTQGLHAAVSDAKGIGFVNLFSAINFMFALGTGTFKTKDAEQCIKSTKKSDFTFAREAFSFKDFTLDIEKLENTRRHHAACFGSCSIVEPDESLTKTFPE